MQRKSLQEATTAYHESLIGSPAEEHLENRGLLRPAVRPKTEAFRLGYVAEPHPGHEMYRGMLAIPYLRRGDNGDWSVVSLRFRCLEDHEHKQHGKYNTTPGDRPRLFNTLALLRPNPTMLITEGEIDALTAQVYGFDAVAVPGATAWQPRFREPLLGYETVFILADGDEPGMRFATNVAKELPNAKVIPCPQGEDVNSWITTPDGFAEFKERIT